jgi:cephalosporin hydroxylase
MPVTSDLIPRLHEEFTARLGQHSDIMDHLQFMHDTVLRYPDPVVIELGVRTGNSTSALLSAVTRQGHGALWSADAEPSQVMGYWHDIPAWHFMRGDSVSPAVLEWMPPQADVVFTDTSHTYAQQLAELRAYVPRVRPGGTVLVHDTQCVPYGPPGSDCFLPRPGPEGPVTEALDAYCKETGLAWENRHSEDGFYGLGIIIIPGGSHG